MEIPAEVLELIATHVKDNIRELEGALTRVVAYASLNRQPITLELAEQLLIDIISGDQPRQITPKTILDATAETFGFTVDDLCGQSRRRPLVIARQVGMYVFRDITDFSYPAIAKEFGGRDHTTVIHAVSKIEGLDEGTTPDLRPGDRSDPAHQERGMTRGQPVDRRGQHRRLSPTVRRSVTPLCDSGDDAP